MSDYLAAEPPTDGDATFRNFQRHNVSRAADHFGVTLTGAPTFGWRLRSIGVPVDDEHGPRWLRVVSEEPQWARGHAWTGNLDANTITTLVKPQVLDVFEWPEHDWRNQRAELMTKVPGESCSPTDVLRAPLDVPAEWWTDLRRPSTRSSSSRPSDLMRIRRASMIAYAVDSVPTSTPR